MINEWIQTAIADNGFGIPTAIQQRIFEPLTTKPIGKGTGIDMSISYQIVTEQHGGKIQCVSIPGAETGFVIPILCRQRYAAVSSHKSWLLCTHISDQMPKPCSIPLNPPSKGGLAIRFPPFEGGLGRIKASRCRIRKLVCTQ
jgi:Histidine kinase-, DNA gyrase B-, and HSP90-like ATPase